MDDDLYLNQEKRIAANALVPVDVKAKEFDLLMSIYKQASDQVYEQLEVIKDAMYKMYGIDIISTINSRIKTPTSIINKMKKKNYDINYKNLIENINDVAGIRVITPIKDNIYSLAQIINKLPNVKIIETKDYIKKPKKSGYSGYHIIVETPVDVQGRKVPIKVEIQLRTMAMDFWATNEHKLKYKTNKKLSIFDSKKLQIYAKLLNILDNKMTKMYERQEIIFRRKDDLYGN